MELQTVLAGPILRRVEPTRVCIWVATQGPVSIQAAVYRRDGATGRGDVIGRGAAESVRLGRLLHVHLATVSPLGHEFPADELLAYDLEIDDGQKSLALGDLGLLAGLGRIVYGRMALPTFFIRKQLEGLNLVHGSCRLLHGKGEDALASVDELLSRTALDLAERPGAMFLTGDQVYADDVAGPLVPRLRALAESLIGPQDDSSVPGWPKLSSIELYGRAEAARDRAKLTSDKSTNHLMSFGEFAAMYLLAWNQDNWPEVFPGASEVLSSSDRPATASFRKRRKYEAEIRDLERARAALPAVRRVLANVPVYCCFDDHDVTDDWNITQRWSEKVSGSPSGRRMVANALASFWAFQGWGNDPDLYPAPFKRKVSEFLSGTAEVQEKDFEDAMWSFDAWSYAVPTRPLTVVMDTRTQRAFDSPEGAARLAGPAARERLCGLAKDNGYEPGGPLIIVSPVPVCGLELQERRQKFLVKRVGPYEIDFEAWQSNLQGFVDLMRCLIDDLGLETALFLSGDVHYGLNLRFLFGAGPRELAITQLVSSGQKHSGTLSKLALTALGRFVRQRHERIGWDRPPRLEGASKLMKRFVTRAVNTDEWSDDAPVFLSAKRARQLKIEERPDYRELRLYVKPSGPGSSVLVGENNVGFLSLRGDVVVHRHLSRSRSQTTVRSATMRLRSGRVSEPGAG